MRFDQFREILNRIYLVPFTMNGFKVCVHCYLTEDPTELA